MYGTEPDTTTKKKKGMFGKLTRIATGPSISWFTSMKTGPVNPMALRHI